MLKWNGNLNIPYWNDPLKKYESDKCGVEQYNLWDSSLNVTLKCIRRDSQHLMLIVLFRISQSEYQVHHIKLVIFHIDC